MEFLHSFGLLNSWLVFINILGFLLFAIRTRFGRSSGGGLLPTIAAILGGSGGILLAMLFFDPKPDKETMMLRVTTVCLLIVQILGVLVCKGYHSDRLSFAILPFFTERPILLIYLALINFLTIAAYGMDKLSAMASQSRVRIVTLLGLAFLGGSVGAWISIWLFRHKTRKNYFTIGIPMILATQLLTVFYLINSGLSLR